MQWNGEPAFIKGKVVCFF